MRQGARAIAFFLVACGVLVVAMVGRMGPELLDDGAFFLRYAENMIRGEAWVWNLGEPPVWGASAPLYPLLLALPLAAGLPPVSAAAWLGVLLGATSLAAAATLLYRRFGPVAGISMLLYCSLDTDLSYFPSSGMETPMTLVLLTAGLWVALIADSESGPVVEMLTGVVAGLLAVHKIDLAPAGALLLVACSAVWRRVVWRAVAMAAAVAAGWYGFAWWYFGSPLPNSFWTKLLHQGHLPASIDWRWFGSCVLLTGAHGLLVLLTGAAVARRSAAHRPLHVLALGLLAVHLVAYTVKYPFERYGWYCVPSVFCLAALAALGTSTVCEGLSRWSRRLSRMPTLPRWAAASLLMLMVIAVGARAEYRRTLVVREFSAFQEHDRSQAGRWVRANTPESFVVLTFWGNPAFHAHRRTIDGSFLNRPWEPGDLIVTHRPEVLILQGNPGSTPMSPVFANMAGTGYTVVRIFDRTFSRGMDYYFAVLVRDDALEAVTDVERPRDLFRYIDEIRLGDEWGRLQPYDRETLFVHPGTERPTTFRFDSAGFAAAEGKEALTIRAWIAPIPEDARARGAAVVGLRVTIGGRVVMAGVVGPDRPLEVTFPGLENSGLSFVVDNQGSPDTDWLLISVD